MVAFLLATFFEIAVHLLFLLVTNYKLIISFAVIFGHVTFHFFIRCFYCLEKLLFLLFGIASAVSILVVVLIMFLVVVVATHIL